LELIKCPKVLILVSYLWQLNCNKKYYKNRYLNTVFHKTILDPSYRVLERLNIMTTNRSHMNINRYFTFTHDQDLVKYEVPKKFRMYLDRIAVLKEKILNNEI
jgi:hypothetical protein